MVVQVCWSVIPGDVDEVVVELEDDVLRFVELQLEQGSVVRIHSFLKQHALVGVVELEPQIATEAVQRVPRCELVVELPFFLEPPAVVVRDDGFLGSGPCVDSALRVGPDNVDGDVRPVHVGCVVVAFVNEGVVSPLCKVHGVVDSAEVPDVVPCDVDVVLLNGLVVEHPLERHEVPVMQHVLSDVFKALSGWNRRDVPDGCGDLTAHCAQLRTGVAEPLVSVPLVYFYISSMGVQVWSIVSIREKRKVVDNGVETVSEPVRVVVGPDCGSHGGSEPVVIVPLGVNHVLF